MQVGAEVGSIEFSKQNLNSFQLLFVMVGYRYFDFDRALLIFHRPLKCLRERGADFLGVRSSYARAMLQFISEMAPSIPFDPYRLPDHFCRPSFKIWTTAGPTSCSASSHGNLVFGGNGAVHLKPRFDCCFMQNSGIGRLVKLLL